MERFSAPGRVNLIGEYTDQTGGLALPVAIDRGITISFTPCPGRLVLRSDELPGELDLALADDAVLPTNGWRRYPAAVARELLELGIPVDGISGTLTSTLPMGAGLSSSAALEIAVATALCRRSVGTLDPWVLAQAARRAERRAVGVPCGVMDQAASLMSRGGHALLIDCGRLLVDHVLLPEDVDVVVILSGITRQVSDSAYEKITGELEAAARMFGDRPASDISIDEVETFIWRTNPSAIIASRMRHVVAENERVRAVVRALRSSTPDVDALGRLFAASHESLRELGVSLPALDLLVDLAYRHGALAARLTGAGFGGAIVALTRSQHTGEFMRAVSKESQARGINAVAMRCVSADGAASVLAHHTEVEDV